MGTSHWSDKCCLPLAQNSHCHFPASHCQLACLVFHHHITSVFIWLGHSLCSNFSNNRHTGEIPTQPRCSMQTPFLRSSTAVWSELVGMASSAAPRILFSCQELLLVFCTPSFQNISFSQGLFEKSISRTWLRFSASGVALISVSHLVKFNSSQSIFQAGPQQRTRHPANLPLLLCLLALF